jgi:hypothetical protein
MRIDTDFSKKDPPPPLPLPFFVFCQTLSHNTVLFLAQCMGEESAPGVVAYQGKSSSLVHHLAMKGLPCPEFENPCDHMMRLLQDQESLQLLLAANTTTHKQRQSSSHASHVTNASAIHQLEPGSQYPSTFIEDEDALEVGSLKEEEEEDDDDDAVLQLALLRGNFAVGYLRQFILLAQRFAVDHFRDPRKFLQGLLVRASIGAILGVVWYQQADGTQTSIFPIQVYIYRVCSYRWCVCVYVS